MSKISALKTKFETGRIPSGTDFAELIESATPGIEAKSLVEQIINSGFDTGALSTNITQKLADLEAEYAPQLTAVNQQLADIAINVKTFGAKGNGINDDTNAINSAIEYAFIKGHSTVIVPKGVYMVQGATGLTTYEGQGGGIKMLNGVALKLDSSAIIRQIPTEFGNYNIIIFSKTENSSISGGEIQGDRDEHTGVGGEWGYGIGVFSGKNILIENIKVSNCWGDGINIQMDKGVRNDDSIPLREKQSENVTISNVVSDNNRRQGLSIESLLGGTVKDSEFSNTNGTSPQSGIDIEPYSVDKLVEDVLIYDNKLEDNGQFGLLIMNINTKRIDVYNNKFINNRSSEGQIATNRTSEITISNNYFYCLLGGGVRLTRSSDVKILLNTFKEGSIGLYGSKDVTISDNSLTWEDKTPYNNLVITSQTDDISERVRVNDNKFEAIGISATNYSVSLEGKDISIVDNSFGQAYGVLNVKGIDSQFVFRDNTVIDMAQEGITTRLNSQGIIERNTFSGCCYNGKNNIIIIARDTSKIVLSNNIFYRNRIGGGDLDVGRPSYYVRIEEDSISEVYDNKVDGMSFTKLNPESVVGSQIVYSRGTTGNRPTNHKAADIYYDDTLGKPLWSDGSNWKDAIGGIV